MEDESRESMIRKPTFEEGGPVLKSGFRLSTHDGPRLLYMTCAFLATTYLFGLMSFAIWTYHVRNYEVNQEGKPVDLAKLVETLTVTATVTATSIVHSIATTISTKTTTVVSKPVSTEKSHFEKWRPLNAVRGPATESLRDNLRNDTEYITSWPSAGWTNDVMTYANLIYLGRITDRVPIIPPFVPSHIGRDASSVDFGDVFNVTRLAEAINTPVIEWKDVKTPGSKHLDELGCWNVWEATQYDEHFARKTEVLKQLQIDVSYTTAPEWIKLIPGEIHDKHARFWDLATLSFPDVRKMELRDPKPTVTNNVKLPPDEQLLCYDYLYYVCAAKMFEYTYLHSPAWRYAAQYMHWTDRLEDIAASYVRKTLGSKDPKEVYPKYISVHVRHADFAAWCEVPLKECFAPVSVIARRVKEVQDELKATKGLDVKNVVITSDEKDPEWWKEVNKLGWKSPDHKDTQKTYGPWYPVFIDAVIQSNGVGFVGTDRSTMSEMAMNRARSWHDAPHRMFKWGRKGADDH